MNYGRVPPIQIQHLCISYVMSCVYEIHKTYVCFHACCCPSLVTITARGNLQVAGRRLWLRLRVELRVRNELFANQQN